MASSVVQSPPFSAPARVLRLPDRVVHGQEVVYDTLGNGEFLFAIAQKEMRYQLVFNWLAEVDAKLDEANDS